MCLALFKPCLPFSNFSYNAQSRKLNTDFISIQKKNRNFTFSDVPQPDATSLQRRSDQPLIVSNKLEPKFEIFITLIWLDFQKEM